MTVVVGTAGHIDHGKTTLLRALTGIDADRLPEEQRRGMTLDVGYAHFVLPNGRPLDFVDVPGHDRLVGNMLVGAGEIDAAMLVVAADDGPRAQTIEHLSLLDAYGIVDGLAVITKADLAPAERLEEVLHAVADLLGSTGLAGAPIVTVSATTGRGLESLVEALTALEERASGTMQTGAAPRLAIDRVFTVKGRGTVVTGSLRGGTLASGEAVRILPGETSARVREVQVHGQAVAGAAGVGRTALNLSGVAATDLRRGQVIAPGPGLELSDRLLVALRPPAPLGSGPAAWPPAHGLRVRLHLGTVQAGARIGTGGREGVALEGGRWTAVLRLDAPVAAAVGDRFVLRRPSPGEVVAGGVVLDPLPATSLARRRISPSRLAMLVAATDARSPGPVADALTELHGALETDRLSAVRAVLGLPADASTAAEPVRLAPDVAADLDAAARSLVAAHAARNPDEEGIPIAEVRLELTRRLRRATGIRERSATAAVDRLLAELVATRQLARDGERLRDPSIPAGPSAELAAAMERLERVLSNAAPPALADAAREAGCPPRGVRALESAGRIVRLGADLAWATPTYQRLAAQALAMARRGPLSPAAFRDATGTSRRYVLAILEDLDRRGILERGPDGHRPGPRAPAAPAVGAPAR